MAKMSSLRLEFVMTLPREPQDVSIPINTHSSFWRESFPTRSASAALSTVATCDTFGQPEKPYVFSGAVAPFGNTITRFPSNATAIS